MKPVPRISESEWEVLEVLWNKAPLTAVQVFGKLPARSWKLSTVRTFLTRLEKKGVVECGAGDDAKVYTPCLTREECVQNVSESFLDRIFNGATASLLVYFAKSKRLNDRELADLEAILAQKRKEK